MKKLFKSMMAVAIAACTFTACEDVPEPYNNPYNYTPAEVFEPKGTGTEADPFNVAAAIAKCEEVGENPTAEDVYAVGYVVSISELSTQYGNATFMIADSKDGGDLLTVYHAKGPGNQSITDENLIKVGDKVLVCGKLVNFKSNTPEFTTGCYIVSINGEGGSGEPSGNDETVGTKDAPKSVADALAAINDLEDGKSTDLSWYVKGKVKTVKTTDANITQYKNIDYTIVDEGQTNELTVFRGKYLDNADFTVENKVKEGDEVIVFGKLKKYGTTPEIDQGNYLVSINSNGGTEPTPTPTGDNLLTNGDFETWEGNAPANWNGAAGNATLEQSTDSHGGNSAVLIKTNSANKRLSYKAITLKAGTYNIAFYAKAVSGTAKIAPGYVAIIDGNVDSQNYKYIETYPEVGTEWTAVNHSFTLEANTEVCLVIMKHKSTANDVIIDDYVLSTSDGGIVDGGDNPTPTPEPTGEAKGDGTEANPFNPLGAINYVKTLGTEKSADNVYVKGKIATIKYTYSAQYGTAQYTISETGNATEDQFTVYGSYYHAAEQKWVEGDTQIAIGDEVVVCGKVVNYQGTTPEFVNKENWLVSITKAN